MTPSYSWSHERLLGVRKLPETHGYQKKNVPHMLLLAMYCSTLSFRVMPLKDKNLKLSFEWFKNQRTNNII